MDSVCVLHIFNHRYEGNVNRLRAHYKKYFSKNFFLMPFYKGNEPDVIPVYGSSYTFQSYITQAWKIVRDPAIQYYVVSADDLIINPHINEYNLIRKLRLSSNTGYIKRLLPLSSETLQWGHMSTVEHVFSDNPFLKYESELPVLSDATARFARHGAILRPVTWKNLKSRDGWQYYSTLKSRVRFLLRYRGKWEIPYPIARCYSDFFIIPASAFDEFCHLSGLFAAMNLFAEMAIPTAMAMACDELRFEADIDKKGMELWGEKEIAQLRTNHDNSFERLLADFPVHWLYIHPIKLSQWS